MTATLEVPVFAPPRKAMLKTSPVPLPAVSLPVPRSNTGDVPAHGPRTAPKTPRPWEANPHLRVIGVTGSAPAPAAPPVPVLDLCVLPSAEQLRDWVEHPVEGQLRFATAGAVQFGNLAPEEAAYFEHDFTCLMEGAAAVAAALGLSRATVAALAEPARAVCYWRLTEGCAGSYGAAGTGIATLLGLK